MKEQLRLLRQLQTIDLHLDGRKAAMEQIQQQLLDHKTMLQKLDADLERQRLELEETITLKADRERELLDAEGRHGTSKERLMTVSSTKEYNAVEKEMDTLKKKTEETRERLDHLTEAIEVAERAIKEKEDKIVEVRAYISDAESKALGKIARLETELGASEAQRSEARATVKQSVVRRYDFIRGRIGNAIVAAKNAHCEGCFMAVPPQLYIEIQRASSLVQCPSCQRILYYYEDDVEQAADA